MGGPEMKPKENEADVDRRGFLKLAGSAPAAAAVVAIGGEAAAEEAEAPKGAGLRKTAHVKAYLDSARF